MNVRMSSSSHRLHSKYLGLTIVHSTRLCRCAQARPQVGPCAVFCSLPVRQRWNPTDVSYSWRTVQPCSARIYGVEANFWYYRILYSDYMLYSDHCMIGFLRLYRALIDWHFKIICNESRDSFRLISTLRSGWRGRLCYVLARTLEMYNNPNNTSGLYKSSLTASAPIRLRLVI